MLQTIEIILIWYLILGLIVIGIGLVTELVFVGDWPKFSQILFLYAIWPIFAFWYIRYTMIYIDFIVKYSKKYNRTYSETFKNLIDDFPQESGSLFK